MLGQWMEQEIREQPSRLAHGAESYYPQLQNAIGNRKFDMILLTARGSSDNAALYARYLFEVFLKTPVSLAAPSVLTRYKSHVKYKNCLAIGISQSGAAPDVSEVLSTLRKEGHLTLAITNTADSAITQAAAHSLLLDAGLEKSVAATKTYTSSLLALYEVARVLRANLPPPAGLLPDDAWVEQTLSAARESSGLIVRNSTSFALGRGFGFATAQESALKLMECALIPCKAYSSADFEHGPKALAGHGSTIISFDGPMKPLAKQGCDMVLAPKAKIGDTLSPIWEIVFGQWLALMSARARGLNPDVPRYIRKVTRTK